MHDQKIDHRLDRKSAVICNIETWVATLIASFMRGSHGLNMELDTKVYMDSCAQLYSLAEPSKTPPPHAFGLIYEGAIGPPR
jgi:hypothetical protein